MAEGDTWDTKSLEPKKKAAVPDTWDDEDEEDDIKDNWDDEGNEEADDNKAETKNSNKKLSDKIKEKEELQRKKQEELRKRSEESPESTELTPDEEPAEKLQDGTDLQQANEAVGVSNSGSGIDAISPSSRDDFTEFEKLLKDKLSPYEKSIHYSGFLESLFRDLCLTLEVDDLKKINSSITVLLTEKQKQEKQQNTKGKKKKKGVVPAGGFKAKMKDDLADYGEFEGGYTQDYEDFI